MPRDLGGSDPFESRMGWEPKQVLSQLRGPGLPGEPALHNQLLFTIVGLLWGIVASCLESWATWFADSSGTYKKLALDLQVQTSINRHFLM